MDVLGTLPIRFYFNGKFINAGKKLHYYGGIKISVASRTCRSFERPLLGTRWNPFAQFCQFTSVGCPVLYFSGSKSDDRDSSGLKNRLFHFVNASIKHEVNIFKNKLLYLQLHNCRSTD